MSGLNRRATAAFILLSALVAIQAALGQESLSLHFDAPPLGPGVQTDATGYLGRFGITLSNLTPGSSVLIAGQGSPGLPIATSGSNYLSEFNENKPQAMTLNFPRLMSLITFSRTGLTYDSKPQWSAEALNAVGRVVATVGEPISTSGLQIANKIFTLTGAGIAALRIKSDNQSLARLSGVPIDDLTLIPQALVTLNFDKPTLGPGMGLDPTSYLSSYGISLSNVTPGASVLMIAQNSPALALASSGSNYFSEFNGNKPETMTLNFLRPLSVIAFNRTGMTYDSKPEWSAEALTVQGKVLHFVGEQITYSGAQIPRETFTLEGIGITALRITSDSRNLSNLSGVPIDDLTLVLSVSPPFGLIDTPADNITGVAGAIGVTGWAIASSGIQKSEMWREPLPGETAADNGLVFIGVTALVPGARPDLENAFPGYPNNNFGWGAQILTNQLPGNGTPGLGNGLYKIHVLVTDNTGQQVDVGTRVIDVDNAHSVLPFGTIDTPVPGATVSGEAYVNFGWVVTPNPSNGIPKDGSTISVYIDNNLVGHPVYNNFRQDIATAFPGLQNSNGAVGYFSIDTTKYTNGLHTISWTASDTAQNSQGLGSRFFNVLN